VGFEVLTVVNTKVISSGIYMDMSSNVATCFHASGKLGLFFGPEYGGDMFLLNVC
jgi:hypothetical protein